MSNPLDDDHMEAARKYRENSGEMKKAYKNWQNSVKGETDFESKTQELLALSAAASIQCKYCVHTHGQKALEHGASEEEIAQVIHIASQVKAGATMSYGLEALEHTKD